MWKPKPRKLGHIVLYVKDIRKSAEFYTEIVGLEVSDWIDDQLVFLRCSTDHHDLALVQMSEADKNAARGRQSLEHFSYQVESLDDINRMVTFLQDQGIQIDRGPGKHGPGENYFMAFKDPDGNNVEFYSDMRQITEEEPYEPSVWPNDVSGFDQWRFEKFAVEPPAMWLEKLRKEDAMKEGGN